MSNRSLVLTPRWLAMMLRPRERLALTVLVALISVACRERPAPPSSDAAIAVVVAADASPPAPTPEPTEAPIAKEATPAASGGAVAADLGPLGGPHRPSGIMQCKSNAAARDSALGIDQDRALDCPLAIGDRSQRPPWRGSLVVSLTKQRRAVAGVSKDDCCYAMDGSSGRSRGR